MNGKAVSWFEKVSLISKRCIMKEFIHYHKGNVFQAPLEALLTFYLAEMIVFVSNLFVVTPLTSAQMLQVIFVPLIFSALVCIVYSIAMILKISTRLFDCLQEIDKLEGIIEKYNAVDERFKDLFFRIHRLGAICYFLVSLFVSYFYLFVMNIDLKVTPITLVVSITLFGSFFGVVWNYAGFNGDRRVEWSQLLLEFSGIDAIQRTPIIKKKYKYFERQAKTHIMMIILILLITGFCVLNLNEYFYAEFDIFLNKVRAEIEVEVYYLFASLYVMAMYFYIKFLASHFYNRYENGSKIYVNIEELKGCIEIKEADCIGERKSEANKILNYESAENSPEQDIEMLKLLYEEWQFRLSQLWSLMTKATILIIVLMLLPYLTERFGLDVEAINLPEFLFPLLALILSIVIGIISTIEIRKINKIKSTMKDNIQCSFPKFASSSETPKYWLHQDIPIVIFSILSFFAILILIKL